jgi:hypothetical protein
MRLEGIDYESGLAGTRTQLHRFRCTVCSHGACEPLGSSGALPDVRWVELGIRRLAAVFEPHRRPVFS